LERYLDLLSQRQVVVPVVAGKTKKTPEPIFIFSYGTLPDKSDSEI
jgi:hypothetical protein